MAVGRERSLSAGGAAASGQSQQKQSMINDCIDLVLKLEQRSSSPSIQLSMVVLSVIVLYIGLMQIVIQADSLILRVLMLLTTTLLVGPLIGIFTADIAAHILISKTLWAIIYCDKRIEKLAYKIKIGRRNTTLTNYCIKELLDHCKNLNNMNIQSRYLSKIIMEIYAHMGIHIGFKEILVIMTTIITILAIIPCILVDCTLLHLLPSLEIQHFILINIIIPIPYAIVMTAYSLYTNKILRTLLETWFIQPQ